MWIDRRNRRAPRMGAPALRAAKVTLILSLPIILLQGCAAMAIGGVAAGASMAHERRQALTVLDDQRTELSAAQLLRENPDIGSHSRIAITSYDHVVLLTGQAETQAIGDRFAQMVARLPKVKKVVNEVTVGPSASFARESEDALITTRVKLALTEIGIPGFDVTRVKVVTEEGTVYLMGLVYPREGNEAAEKARYVPGVVKVIKVFEYIET